MKIPFKTNTLLPIVLVVVLPGMSLIVNDIEYLTSPAATGYIIIVWSVASFLLYALWHLIQKVWDIPSNKWRAVTIIAIATGFALACASLPNPLAESKEPLNIPLSIRMIMVTVLFVTVQYALRAQSAVARLQLDKEQIQTQNYRVQLQAIRAQIDPHFLFNSLNTLRSMVRENHSNSENFVMNLSDFYRSTLKYNEKSTLPLHEELKVLESFLFVMKYRNLEAVDIHLEIDEQLKGCHIPSLSLQICVENCFKHNSMTLKSPLHIQIQTDHEGPCIRVSNNKQGKINTEPSSRRGLEMIRRRYELLDISDGLRTRDLPDSFEVELKLIEP